MHIEIDGHRLAIQDTGAPRGERNWWDVTLNGVALYGGYSRRTAEEKFEVLEAALKAKGPEGKLT